MRGGRAAGVALGAVVSGFDVHGHDFGVFAEGGGCGDVVGVVEVEGEGLAVGEGDDHAMREALCAVGEAFADLDGGDDGDGLLEVAEALDVLLDAFGGYIGVELEPDHVLDGHRGVPFGVVFVALLFITDSRTLSKLLWRRRRAFRRDAGCIGPDLSLFLWSLLRHGDWMDARPAHLTPTLVLAAITSEVEPLADRLGLTAAREGLGSEAFFYFYGGEGVSIAVTGVGAERAERVAEAAWRVVRPRRVIITGFAGSVHSAYGVGDVIEPAEVCEPAGRTFRPTAGFEPAGRLLTTDGVVASVEAKRRLREGHGADAVDMESAALAAWCERKGVAWTCIRAMSDGAEESLPAFVEKLTAASGEPDVWAAMVYVMTRPWALPGLIRLGVNASRASAAIAERVGDRVEGRVGGRGGEGA